MSLRPILQALTWLILTCPAYAKPNIIYILADDLGYGDLSCYGQTKFSTPHIDALAASGMKFTQHYAGSTVCAPSRCSLMTGLHTGHALVRGNREVQPEGQAPLPANTITVAKRLKSAGYATGAFGKWGLGFPGSEGEPNQQGFDTFYGYNCQRQAHTYYPEWLYRNQEKIRLDGQTYAHDLIMKESLKWIRDHAEKPFFAFLPVTIPHAAMHVPDDYAAPFHKRFPQFEEVKGKYAGTTIRNPVAKFAGMMKKLDDDVGRLTQLLHELEIHENTLVIFTSDNGPHIEGGHKPYFFDSNGPLNGLKRDLTEGGIRVPFIATWPGTIEAGSISHHVSAFWDFLPTACDLAGAHLPPDLDGISYLPELLGKTQDQHDYLYWEFFERGGRRAARFGNIKAVQLNVHKNPHGPIAIYDLDRDIGETQNLAKDRGDLVQRATEIFAEAHTPSPHWKFGH